MSEMNGTTARTDADAHGGPTMSEMAAGGIGTSGSSTGTRQESPAGPGQTGDERREPVDSVGGSEGLPGRALGMLRERPVAVGSAVLVCVAVVVLVVIRALRRT
ncbi:hypothetical protein J2X63_001871 [Agromyces sp. 3263]|uniref:hypothetical protein n=1 Tax=Agromyces sp. 3263 TaxID=2817750 RepID=UPI0028578826|nr:hypothetical protein [Agromyces sp. 3263]MDR6906185.1 hypothetical protein [Agromyces sp. 3263]